MLHNVRQATPDDAPAIARIHHESWLVTYPNERAGITDEDVIVQVGERAAREAKWRKGLETQPDTMRTFVALDGEHVVGFCKVDRKHPESELDALYIDLAYLGKGVASILTEKALAWLGNGHPVMLKVAAYNERAIGFYEKMGFSRAEDAEPFLLGTGKSIPLIVMRKK